MTCVSLMQNYALRTHWAPSILINTPTSSLTSRRGRLTPSGSPPSIAMEWVRPASRLVSCSKYRWWFLWWLYWWGKIVVREVTAEVGRMIMKMMRLMIINELVTLFTAESNSVMLCLLIFFWFSLLGIKFVETISHILIRYLSSTLLFIKFTAPGAQFFACAILVLSLFTVCVFMPPFLYSLYFMTAYFKIPDAAPKKAPEEISIMYSTVGTLAFTWQVRPSPTLSTLAHIPFMYHYIKFILRQIFLT